MFSENFLPENKLCGWLFTDLHNTYAFSWPLANFPDFPLAKKNHISFIIIYITIYIIAFPWLCLSMITLSLTHFGCAVIVPDASNNVQTIGTIIWKCYPDDRKWPGWLRRSTSIDCLNRVEFYADDCEDRVGSWSRNAIRWLRLSGRSKAIPEIITIIPLIENIFGLDAAEVENNLKMFTSRMGAIWN